MSRTRLKSDLFYFNCVILYVKGNQITIHHLEILFRCQTGHEGQERQDRGDLVFQVQNMLPAGAFFEVHCYTHGGEVTLRA